MHDTDKALPVMVPSKMGVTDCRVPMKGQRGKTRDTDKRSLREVMNAGRPENKGAHTRSY